MPASWSAKDERQYKHILKSCTSRRDRPRKRCKSIAAATVNARRADEGRTLDALDPELLFEKSLRRCLKRGNDPVRCEREAGRAARGARKRRRRRRGRFDEVVIENDLGAFNVRDMPDWVLPAALGALAIVLIK